MRNIVGGLFGARIQIGLTRDAMAIVYRGPTPRKQITILADGKLTADIAREPQSLSRQCKEALGDAKYRQLPLHVVLDDSWARLFLVTPPHNVSRMQDLQAAAAMRFQALFGDAPGDWQIEADWQTASPFVACALPRTLISGLRQIATDHHLHLHAVQPQFVSAWNKHRRAIRNDGWFGVVLDNSLTLGVLAASPVSGKQELQAVRSVSIPTDGHALSWLQEQLTRMALQMNTACPGKIYLAGNQRQHWAGSTQAETCVVQNLDGAKFTDATKAAISPANLMTQSELGL
jgi:hypothetical protein